MLSPTIEEARQLALKSNPRIFFLCASCPKWWEGQSLGKDGCTGTNCGSPVRRSDFPEYAGTIKDFSALCFVCGSDDVLAYAKVQGSDRQFGMCSKHLEVIDSLIYKNPAATPQFEEKKVLIFPNPARVIEKYRDVRSEL